MEILILNWRDIKNPISGGAELFTHEIAKRLIAQKHKITLYTSAFPDCRKKETVDGVVIIRRGNEVTVRFWAFLYYLKNRKNIDLVIDEINTIPFLTPLYAKKRIALIHQLAKEVFFYETNPILAVIGFLLEPIWLKLYRNTQAITISECTKRDLEKIGFRNVSIIKVGIDFKVLDYMPMKEEKLTLVYLGRIKRNKRIEHILKAFSIVSKKIDANLWMIGKGDKKYINQLKERAAGNVSFLGYVTKKKKIELLKRAHALILTSVREGFGIVVVEAAACATPTIAYDISGLHSSINNPVSGILCKENPHALAEKILEFNKHKELQQFLSRNALNYARQFSWERSARKINRIIERL